MNRLFLINSALKARIESNMAKLRTTRGLILLALLVLLLNMLAAPVNAERPTHSLPAKILNDNLAEAQAKSQSDDGAEVAIAWFELSLELVTETPGFSPPVASRAFGYLGVTLYETVQPGMEGYRSLAGQLNQLNRLPYTHGWAEYHWPSAANAALASMMRMLFPTASDAHQQAIAALEQHFAERYQADVEATIYRRSVAWGLTLADAIFAWSMNDGGHAGYLHSFADDYVAPVGDHMWVPTPPKYSAALQPYSGREPALCPGRHKRLSLCAAASLF